MTVFTGGQYFLDGRRMAREGAAPGPAAHASPVDGTSSAA
jgi:hypothetical protein